MKTIFAKEKSEYLHCLVVAINLKLPAVDRVDAIKRLVEIETELKNKNDEIQIIVTTINTESTGERAPPMNMEDILKNKP